MVINHNLMANNAIRSMNSNSASASKSMQKLSSGLRINSAADDAAGLAISEKMRGQIRGLDQASSNAQDGISMTQTAEGALNETQSILQRMRELSNQAANGTNTTDDRGSIQDEMNQLTSEINRIGNTTEFNTQKLLNGGIGSTDGQKITQATSADLKSGTFTATNATGIGAKLTVDNVTFDFANVGVSLSGDTATTMVNKLKDITSGGTKLSDLVDVTNNSGKIEFKAKSQGANSSVTLKTTDAAASNVFGTTAAASTITATGDPTLVEKAGLEATAKLDAADKTILKGDSIKITVGSDSAVTVDLNSIADKTYNTSNSDKNVSKAAMSDLIKDVNAAIQKAGLSDKVEASLSKDNKVQFISKTGADISVANGTGTPLTTLGGGFSAVKNVSQVVGPGAEGSGFNTTFQIGANKGQSMSVNISDMRAAALGITGNAGQAGFSSANNVTDGTNDTKQEAALDVTTKENASKALSTLDTAISKVSSERGKLGAIQNRLEHTINNLGTSSENLTSAESRIRDVDMAKEMSTYSKNNILSQAAQAMLAQANQQPQQVLSLLR
ncbi:flagellin [Clostridium beijerinckii]|uniref:Flagellin n=1 Tax=Clostridium beijerinckii TaxID=1520 RepID=A0A9Q5D313_CLOBE|nr:flagellin [Clostridium beijerinckii]AQS07143.1 flagellin [Clostridium beijerinckii]MBA2883639.1 flagellin [Clostridium beijerinckii]MBA2898826.1 flagellin [Clostridium beijerinckii]MBA2908226.1 flagellin [Clostridium beijerinckii]MBA9013225.1 flagellin [Clostridium beijerinckii]